EWSVDIEFVPVIGHSVVVPGRRVLHPSRREDPLDLYSWRARQPYFNSSVNAWNRLRDRAVDDLGILRIRDPENPDHAVFAAGIPWFMTLFGRDSVIASWEALLLDVSCSFSTVEVLARHQGIADNPVTAEAPGKIFHEMRLGERADPSLGGSHVYYGTVDATPLFIMLAGELLRFGTERAQLERLMPAVEDAVQWMRRWGDVDGDGLIEYRNDAAAFLWNQGW